MNALEAGGSVAARVTKGSSDYARIERAIRFIEAHAREQPSLADVAGELGMSEFHFQRLFQRWAGVSPKRFLQFLTLRSAKQLLEESQNVLEVSYAVGLSGPSRLHELFLSLERITPGEYRSAALGLTVWWAVEETALGPAVFAAIQRGLCGVSFVGEGGEPAAVRELEERWPGATFVHAPERVIGYAAAFRERLQGDVSRPLGVVLKGTPLQLRVWEGLLRIPYGHVASYRDVARLAGAPSAVRAVASAIGHNPIACLIPCHRVLQSTGAFGQYRWGETRKRAVLGIEHADRRAAS